MAHSPITLERLDHVVLTVRDIVETCDFYEGILGMTRRTYGPGRVALHFGRHKINLHPHPSPIDPKAAVPAPGSADLCIVASTPIEQVIAHLNAQGVDIEVGPVERMGALGPMRSIYIRDPNGNLIEVSNYERE